MIFLYNEQAGVQTLGLKGDGFAHIKVARIRENETVNIRNLADENLYVYKVVSITRNEAILELINFEKFVVKPSRNIKIFWCGVDPKTVEKTVPFLNELGVLEVVIIRCERTQGSFKYDLNRLQRIAISSCEQCGRSTPLIITESKKLPEEPFYLVDFCGQEFKEKFPDGNYLIGPEGGFSDKEREILLKKASGALKFGSNSILRSETAVIALASQFI